MAVALSSLLLAAALGGLLLLAGQYLALRGHLRGASRPPLPGPPRPSGEGAPVVSVLKPLCGADDDLAANLDTFAALDYPDYEVLLGVRSPRDPACAVARAAMARHPGRFRLCLQRGEPGMNPKVNQLLTLARVARGELLVVSDSNVQVHPDYLAEIAVLLRDPAVGLVTHPIVGVGEERLGSVLDGLQLAGGVAPGVVAAKRLAGHDIVVGKSMAFRRSDLDALGGFAAVKDVLAEDFVLGRMVPAVLGKRVAVARRPVRNVSQRRSVADFFSRYQRWSVLQRALAGPALHAAQGLLNPTLLATGAAALAPCPRTLGALAAVAAARALHDEGCARLLRGRGYGLAAAAAPVKDLVLGAAWAHGLFAREVVWRGNRLRVLPGSRLEPARPRRLGRAAPAARAA
ncbi:glycosyltransferase [Anaeromyxobacter paludicola]|uniref:Ceramide glucosyltransferase n=1 Tax=Anaeromyxobacter paludicola TaxID=2918171 RepID=A0ABN6NAF1_9BACT|nr:glycosyltransferase [Anaeromyxobacter paludicola]BDG09325.1 ceramide glucosyltransferase [Anaeromyxobacter paludicola]